MRSRCTARPWRRSGGSDCSTNACRPEHVQGQVADVGKSWRRRGHVWGQKCGHTSTASASEVLRWQAPDEMRASGVHAMPAGARPSHACWTPSRSAPQPVISARASTFWSMCPSLPHAPLITCVSAAQTMSSCRAHRRDKQVWYRLPALSDIGWEYVYRSRAALIRVLRELGYIKYSALHPASAGCRATSCSVGAINGSTCP